MGNFSYKMYRHFIQALTSSPFTEISRSINPGIAELPVSEYPVISDFPYYSTEGYIDAKVLFHKNAKYGYGSLLK